MTTISKLSPISFQVSNFVKIKIYKVDKSPLHPNTLLGNVIEVENGCESCNQIWNSWIIALIAPNRVQITADMNGSL